MRSFGVRVKAGAIELGRNISAWCGQMDEDECRRTVCRWRMIGQAALAKKGNNRRVNVGLKVRRIERCRIGATVHLINANGRIDLMAEGNVAAKRRA